MQMDDSMPLFQGTPRRMTMVVDDRNFQGTQHGNLKLCLGKNPRHYGQIWQ